MQPILVSERTANSSHITYLYHTLADTLNEWGGRGELVFGEGRAALKLYTDEKGANPIRRLTREQVAEIIGVGYKYEYFDERINVCLGKKEKRHLIASVISADLDGDKAYIIGKLKENAEYSIDGFYNFRSKALREKWDRILSYIPAGFSSKDLIRFCSYLVGESRKKVYLKGNTVFDERFRPLKRSRLTGKEDVETELLLSDAGVVYCLGSNPPQLGDFLQKYYADRVVFS